MKHFLHPLAWVVLLATVALAGACGRGTPAPTAPEPPVATDTAPAPSTSPAPTRAPPPKPIAYKVEGGADAWHGVGIVCDFEKPFRLEGGGLTVEFTPASNDGGTYRYDGTLHGFRVYGGEAYSVEWVGTEPVKLKGWGVGTVDTPMGPRSDNGIEHYTVERSPEACPAIKPTRAP